MSKAAPYLFGIGSTVAIIAAAAALSYVAVDVGDRSSPYLAEDLSVAERNAQVGFSPVADLGNVMFVGDSITHGVAAASYRWPLFKIWVDNGIGQHEVGVNTANYSGGVNPGTNYCGVVFRNVHSAISSERAYEISGRNHTSDRLEGTDIHDWLGLDASYSGKRRIDVATEMPDTFIMMIGTNDTLSDSGKVGIHTCIDEKQDALLGKKRGKKFDAGGDLSTIVAAMRKANPKARIAVTTIPTWKDGRKNNNDPKDFKAIEDYNKQLKVWGAQNGVEIVDINRGMIDVARCAKIPFVALGSMFGKDKLHPSAQGDLVIAGNVARQLGYAGRTAGLERKPAAEFPVQAADLVQGAKGVTTGKKDGLSLAAGASLSYSASGDAGEGATVEIRFSKAGLGNGAKGGWELDKPVTVRLGTGSATGSLSVNEAYVQWNGQVLYSADMSQIDEPIRIAWVAPGQGLAGGFYVWLGDMLIGEGLVGSPGGQAGVAISSGSPVKLSKLSFDPAASWAPDSARFTVGKPAAAAGRGDGAAAAPETPETLVDKPLSKGIRGNEGAHVGDIALRVTSTAGAPASQWNSLNQGGALAGSAALTVDSAYSGTAVWGSFFGATNGKVSGDVTLSIEADNFRVQAGAFGPVKTAVAGAYKSEVGGALRLRLLAGRYEGAVYGGAIAGKESIGSTQVELGGGHFLAPVYAGGACGVIAGDARLTVHGEADVQAELLCAGGHQGLKGLNGGSIKGDSVLTLVDVQAGKSFAGYAGALSGGSNVAGARKLILQKVKLPKLAATLADFDEVSATQGTQLALSGLGGARKLIVDAESSLALGPGAYEASVLNSGSIAVPEGATLSLRAEGTDENEGGVYEVKGGVLKANGVRMSNRVKISAGSVAGLGKESFRGAVEVDATGAVDLGGVDGGSVERLTVRGGGSVKGLSGSVAGMRVVVALPQAADAAPCVEGDLGVTGSLVIRPSLDKSAGAQQVAVRLCSGKLAVDESKVSVNADSSFAVSGLAVDKAAGTVRFTLTPRG